MLREIPDVESFDHVVTKLFQEVEESTADTFDIYSMGEKFGLNEGEIEAMYFHLKRGEMIEQADGSLVRFSKYGHMMQNGEINHGYVPIP